MENLEPEKTDLQKVTPPNPKSKTKLIIYITSFIIIMLVASFSYV